MTKTTTQKMTWKRIMIYEKNINDILDDDKLSGVARTNRALPIVLEMMKCGVAWHRETLYKAIMVKVRKA